MNTMVSTPLWLSEIFVQTTYNVVGPAWHLIGQFEILQFLSRFAAMSF